MVNEKKERRILWLSFLAGLAFAIVEFLFAISSRSQSVLMDSVYDTTELIFIALIMFLTPLFYKPISEKHPYGFYQIESIFLIIKGVMMLSVTFGVSAEIIEAALSGGNPVDEMDIAAFQLVLGLCSVVIYFVMKRMDRDLASPTVKVELMEWRLDIAYSMGLSFAFYASTFLRHTRLSFIAPYFDPLVAVVVMVLMLPENIRMLWGAVKDIFLFSPDDEIVETIRGICREKMEGQPIDPVYIDVTRTGRHMWVAVYISTDAPQLPVSLIRSLTRRIDRAVKETYENSSCELILAP